MKTLTAQKNYFSEAYDDLREATHDFREAMKLAPEMVMDFFERIFQKAREVITPRQVTRQRDRSDDDWER